VETQNNFPQNSNKEKEESKSTNRSNNVKSTVRNPPSHSGGEGGTQLPLEWHEAFAGPETRYPEWHW